MGILLRILSKDFALTHADFVVVDNCLIHHGRAEQILSLFLDQLEIEYIFTPMYAPDLNPVELSSGRGKIPFLI